MRALDRDLATSKTELGRKLPASRTKGRAGSAVRLLERRHLTPDPTHSLRPRISLNCYSLFHATIKPKRPLLRAVAASNGSYNDQELIYIAKARTVEAFFRAIEGKVRLRSLASRSNPMLAKYRPESRTRTERGREKSLSSLMTARIRTNRSESRLEGDSDPNQSPIFLGHRLDTSPSRPRTALQVIGLAPGRAVYQDFDSPAPVAPPHSYKEPLSPLSPATAHIYSSNLPSPPTNGWRPLHTRTLRLSPKRTQRTPVLKGLAS